MESTLTIFSLLYDHKSEFAILLRLIRDELDSAAMHPAATVLQEFIRLFVAETKKGGNSEKSL
jgi:hypothetical protein